MSFSYDGFGNRTSQAVTKGSGTASSFSYSAATNRITTSGYAYDSNGNLTSMPGLTLGYDVSNRVVSVTGASVNEQYGYDPSNRRMWRPLPAGAFEITFYGMAGERLGTWKLLSGQLTNLSTNLYFAGKLIRQKQINAYGGVEDAAVVTDRMGAVRMRTNSKTATPDPILQNTQLYPFGEELSPATANDRDKFATYYRDSTTGLDYAMNRYYGSTLGRFTTPDPSRRFNPADPRSLNQYSYTGGDPVNNVDKAGLQWELIGCEQFINIGEDQPWSVCAYRWFSSSLNMGSTAAFLMPSRPVPFELVRMSDSDQRTYNNALDLAKEIAGNPDCDSSLSEFGIPSLKALLSSPKMIDNVYDGRKSRYPITLNDQKVNISDYFKDKRNSVAAVVFTDATVMFLGPAFFDPTLSGVRDFIGFARAFIVAHESAHLAGGKTDDDFGGSKALTKKLIDDCYPILRDRMGGLYK
ncbi:MAG: RHS repeat-associated core domain-containing protein [Acidobacteriota bacterium]